MPIDETFSTVVHKPTGDLRSKHSVCSVVFLQTPARKMVGMVRTQSKAWSACISGKKKVPSLAVLCSIFLLILDLLALPHPSPQVVRNVIFWGLVLEGQNKQ